MALQTDLTKRADRFFAGRGSRDRLDRRMIPAGQDTVPRTTGPGPDASGAGAGRDPGHPRRTGPGC